jgi:ABC-type lipoprotein export system ATPase subunit
MSESLLQTRDLRKNFDNGAIQALGDDHRGVNLEISEGEFVSISGPSGSGKSTLLQLLGGLDVPTSGDVRFKGSVLGAGVDLDTYRLRHVGFVFQAFHLLPALRAIENVQIPWIGTGLSRKDGAERAEALLREMGLEHRLYQYPGQLSAGERQRVAIARSLAHDTERRDARRQHCRISTASHTHARWPSGLMITFRKIVMAASTAMVALLPHTAPAQTASSASSGPLVEVRKNIEMADFRATGRLVNVAADGSRTSYKISIKGHWFPDGLCVFYEILSPNAAKVQLLLHMTANGSTTIEVAHPGDPKPSALTAEHWHDSLLGTAFSYEDLVDAQFFWKGQTAQDPAKCGARDCLVLKSVPTAGDHSQYASVTSLVDNKIFFPIHVIKTVRATGEQRDFLYEGLRQTSGVWSASQIEVKVSGKPGSSLLIIERGSAKARLTRQDFVLGQRSEEGAE